MTAAALVARARAAGLQLRVEEGRLLVRPASALTAEIRAGLAAEREAVIACLRSEPPEGGRLLENGRVWIPPPVRPGWCPCGEERAHDPVTGLCRTCAAVVADVRRRVAPAGRCTVRADRRFGPALDGPCIRVTRDLLGEDIDRARLEDACAVPRVVAGQPRAQTPADAPGAPGGGGEREPDHESRQSPAGGAR